MIQYLPYLLVIVGLILLTIAFFYKNQLEKLKKTGILVEGIVLEQQLSNSQMYDPENPSLGKYDNAVVRFVTKGGEWVTGPIKQDWQISFSGQYKEGQKVEIYYDEQNPSNFYVNTGQSPIQARLLFAFVGAGLLLFGIYKL